MGNRIALNDKPCAARIMVPEVFSKTGGVIAIVQVIVPKSRLSPLVRSRKCNRMSPISELAKVPFAAMWTGYPHVGHPADLVSMEVMLSTGPLLIHKPCTRSEPIQTKLLGR